MTNFREQGWKKIEENKKIHTAASRLIFKSMILFAEQCQQLFYRAL